MPWPGRRWIAGSSASIRASRPKGKAAERVDGLASVVKVERLFATIEGSLDERSVTAVAKIVGTDTLERFTRDLAALHVPMQMDWAARFGLPAAPPPSVAAAAAATPSVEPEPGLPANQGREQRPVCASCGRRLSDMVTTTLPRLWSASAYRWASAIHSSG